MNPRFRDCSLDQVFLLPPALQDWLPEGHLARFIADITDQLDLSEILAVYTRKDGRGMAEKEKQLQKEVDQLLAQAAQTDAAEDAQYGKGKRGDELPEELARRESRLKKIAEAKAALEQEARERATVDKAVAEAKLEERRRQEEA